MKKQIIKAIFAGLLISCAAIFTGCADANGLHNQQAVNLTIVFTNFPESVNGEYAIPGDFDGDSSWENDNTHTDIIMKNGEGTSNVFTCTASWTKFTLVKVNDSSWLRGWASSVSGNSEDNGKLVNFWSDIDLNAGDVTLTVDGSSGKAEITAE